MAKLTPKELLESLRQSKEGTAEPLQQPRGLSVPAAPPPAEIISTPGVADSAERAAHRAELVARVRKQQEDLPVVTADQAFHGAVAGAAAGLGILLLRSLFSVRAPTEPEYPQEGYQEEELYDE